jgi:copper chaperone
MQTEIVIANLSCGGCVNTITKRISSLEGVNKVSVSLENNIVTTEHNDNVSRAEIASLLKSLGYPEATEENGLLTKIQSKISCAKGKFSE